ncbi:YaaA family protein [Actinoplanes sp. NPDC049265]|uniref:YaaA family protein n=1 Tax=Actinoplanes sp. NPDC049265 TaxID=3363902 RepID=UPI00371CAB59
MLILLPPSEGKSAPATGAPADLDALWRPELARHRRRVLTKLVAMCGRGSTRGVNASLATLGLTAGQHPEVTRNAGLLTAPAAPASEVYSGVLYEALGFADLPPAAQEWVAGRAVVFSGLWGAVRLSDRIPAYRCSAGVTLPGLGGLTPYWKKALTPALNRTEGPILDLRSGAYAAMWTPSAPAVAVRVLHERVADGVAKRSVVSHFNKATKGRLVRSLALVSAEPRTVDELVEALRDLKHTVEERSPGQLDLIVKDL